MEQDEKIKAVIQKLRKLQKFYEGAKKINSEGEVQAAAAAIQRLLEEYNLTMQEVGGANDEKLNNTITESRIEGEYAKTHGGEWLAKLTKVICKHNFCKFYYLGNSSKTLLVVGKKENVEIVIWMRNMLAEKYYKMGLQRYREFTESFESALHPQRKNPWLRRYLIGCAEGLEYKLTMEENAQKIKERERHEKVTALVVCNNEAITHYMQQTYSEIKPARQRTYLGWNNASEKGFADGKNTEIYKPINNGNNNNVNLLK